MVQERCKNGVFMTTHIPNPISEFLPPPSFQFHLVQLTIFTEWSIEAWWAYAGILFTWSWKCFTMSTILTIMVITWVSLWNWKQNTVFLINYLMSTYEVTGWRSFPPGLFPKHKALPHPTKYHLTQIGCRRQIDQSEILKLHCHPLWQKPYEVTDLKANNIECVLLLVAS